MTCFPLSLWGDTLGSGPFGVPSFWGVGCLSSVTWLPLFLWGDPLGWDPSEPHGLAAPYKAILGVPLGLDASQLHDLVSPVLMG